MTDVLFYHLERQPIERVLPALIERTLTRGWRAVIQAGSQERVDALDDLLWIYQEGSFIPHGTARDGHGELQAVYLTVGAENPNGSKVRFLVDGADCADLASYERVVYLFDGHDEAALAAARGTWKRARGEGHVVTYWQQDERGQWQKKS